MESRSGMIGCRNDAVCVAAVRGSIPVLGGRNASTDQRRSHDGAATKIAICRCSIGSGSDPDRWRRGSVRLFHRADRPATVGLSLPGGCVGNARRAWWRSPPPGSTADGWTAQPLLTIERPVPDGSGLAQRPGLRGAERLSCRRICHHQRSDAGGDCPVGHDFASDRLSRPPLIHATPSVSKSAWVKWSRKSPGRNPGLLEAICRNQGGNHWIASTATRGPAKLSDQLEFFSASYLARMSAEMRPRSPTRNPLSCAQVLTAERYAARSAFVPPLRATAEALPTLPCGRRLLVGEALRAFATNPPDALCAMQRHSSCSNRSRNSCRRGRNVPFRRLVLP